MQYSIVKIDNKYIQINRQKIFDTWCEIWKGSFWEVIFDRNIDEDIGYFTDLVNHGIGYAIEDNDSIIGFLFGTYNYFPKPKTEEERFLFTEMRDSNRTTAFLYELVIDSNYRNQGLGRLLLEKFVKHCEEQDIDQILLYTDANGKSRKFYEKNEFSFLRTIEVERKGHPKGSEWRAYYVRNLR